ncbi:Retrovirus-related Pol polyprotein from transposon TNT 1-94 [Gossypium australe]|uniref:Retrovirus-related Pol polyprotein from transposon TNT 1-94 n=1 Tax=Gossypium australe TaxID=47621 RepID=A0A5B6W656_9ROSI|nr:Retrovirus-related Pol polyprotein from transposon TNT 1-94 [Gossypium australe]
MYAMVCTHPDISHVVSNHGQTRQVTLAGSQLDFQIFTRLYRRLKSEEVSYRLFAISWRATFQATVALSSAEAKYMEITKAVNEAIWLRDLFSELGNEKGTTVVYCDNESVIHLTEDQMHHKRTKHINIRYYFVREVVT